MEIFVLLVLLLIAVGCQQEWIVITDDGPRFDWYALVETEATEPPSEDIPELPSDDPIIEPEETGGPAIIVPGNTRPHQPNLPVTTEPEETTEPENETVPQETREDELPRIPAT